MLAADEVGEHNSLCDRLCPQLAPYQHVVGKALSTSFEDMRINKSLPCEDSNYDCNDPKMVDQWEGTDLKFEQGRYAPPQCQGENAKYCQEILGATPFWTRGFWEQQLNYTKLNFTLAYLGVQNLPTVILNKKAAGEDFIFHWVTPDPLLAKVDAQAIAFKPFTRECKLYPG